jgi:CheY-like chemotaxis protein
MTALILVVDDDPIQRRLLEAMARRFGYDVETADSGEGALARLVAGNRPPINLVIPTAWGC